MFGVSVSGFVCRLLLLYLQVTVNSPLSNPYYSHVVAFENTPCCGNATLCDVAYGEFCCSFEMQLSCAGTDKCQHDPEMHIYNENGGYVVPARTFCLSPAEERKRYLTTVIIWSVVGSFALLILLWILLSCFRTHYR